MFEEEKNYGFHSNIFTNSFVYVFFFKCCTFWSPLGSYTTAVSVKAGDSCQDKIIRF